MDRHEFNGVDSIFGPLVDDTSVDGIAIPRGFHCRVVARSGQPVGGTRWHPAPDDGACFADGDGWIYVSNSEIPLAGGASAIRFGPDGEVKDAYRILDGTSLNHAGVPTPWGSWLSCEDILLGRIHETDPFGQNPARAREAMGRFTHSAAACDPDREVVYLTEDESDGCFYRFTPDVREDLSTGRLEVLRTIGTTVEWLPVPEPAPGFLDTPTRDQVAAARHFDGAVSCHYSDGVVYFTTRDAVWAYDAANRTLKSTGDSPADLSMEINVITPERTAAPVVRVEGHDASQITGAAFSPDGSRLYFSSQRGESGSSTGGITYEVTGPFQRT